MPADHYLAADGTRFAVGDEMWNYYDMVPVTILEPAAEDGWFRTTGALLNGERMCSMATARQRGWLKKV